MLLPALKNARESAKRATCVNNLKQLGIVMHLYADDNGGFFPTRATGLDTIGSYSCCGQGMGLLVRQPVGWNYNGYLADARVAYCPSEKAYNYAGPSGSYPGWAKEGYLVGYIFFAIHDYDTSAPTHPNYRNSDPPNRAMMMDLGWQVWASLNLVEGIRPHAAGNNVLYLGGSVRLVSSAKMDGASGFPALFDVLEQEGR